MIIVLKRTALLYAIAFLPAISSAAAQERTTVGGYGEVHYTNATGPNTPAEVNVRRFIIYLGHTFSDRLAFRSELELEDTKVEGGKPGGEVALEQAYLDYRIADALTIRSGLVLVPVGIINETHEPPTFNGVNRPSVEQTVIPSTWREIGVGAVGTVPFASGFSYRAYLVNGLLASGFTAEKGIRGGRQEGREASFANPSLTGRLEYAQPGLKVGASFWYGGSANADTAVGTGTFAAPVRILSADVRYEWGAFRLRGVAATIAIGDTDTINAVYGDSVASRISGGYVEGAYNVLAALAPATTQRLDAFVRHERFDQRARRATTVGLTYRPVSNVVFKGDYEILRDLEVLRLGVGYSF